MKRIVLRIVLENTKELGLEELRVREYTKKDDTENEFHLTNSFIEVEQSPTGKQSYHFKALEYFGRERDIWFNIDSWIITSIKIELESEEE